VVETYSINTFKNWAESLVSMCLEQINDDDDDDKYWIHQDVDVTDWTSRNWTSTNFYVMLFEMWAERIYLHPLNHIGMIGLDTLSQLDAAYTWNFFKRKVWLW